MPRRRDPNFTTGHLCRFCGALVPWGEILRLLRVDPDTPPYVRNESACHAGCLEARLRPGLALTFHRHWSGKAPMPDDDEDVAGRDCAFCALPVAPAALVRLRVQRPAGTVRAPEFDEQTLPLHAECLARVSTSRLF
ncbi:MAG: hypothetical protein ABWX67_14990 [Allosphingosinicella sp.]